MNWGHGNQGLRLQRQGSMCVLSGMIRVSKNNIYAGADKAKKFWHSAESFLQLDSAAEADSLMQLDARRKKGWGKLAFISQACRPSTTVKFTVNDHVLPSKIKIKSNGHVVFQSGGTKHGWISLSGVTWKASGRISKHGRGISQQTQGRMIMANGWRGERNSVYKQGDICMLSGDVKGGRSWKGRLLTLPKFCRPRERTSFVMSQGKKPYRVDVTRSGAVIGVNVPGSVRSQMSLNSIVFSTRKGQLIKLNHRRGWKRPKKFAAARAFRMGSLCVVSGFAYNHHVRDGNENRLKNSAAVGKLPAWCRPKKRLTFSTVAPDGQLQRIDVLHTGDVRWEGGRRDRNVNLTGIKFNVPSQTVQKYSKNMLKVTKCRL